MQLGTRRAGRTEPLEQFRRASQRVDEDPGHTIFDLLSGEPPTLHAIRSCRGDQRGGDVVPIQQRRDRREDRLHTRLYRRDLLSARTWRGTPSDRRRVMPANIAMEIARAPDGDVQRALAEA